MEINKLIAEPLSFSILRLVKRVIYKLDHNNKIRKLQKLPIINYDPMEVERLCSEACGDKKSMLTIVKIITETTILSKNGTFYI